MKVVLRSMKTILRNPVRMVLVVMLLAASLMFVAATTSLSKNSQQEIADIHHLVGTTITVNFVTNDAERPGAPAQLPSGAPGFFGHGPQPIPDSVVARIKQTPGVMTTHEGLTRPDNDGILHSGTITDPTGQQLDAPLSMNGIAPDDSDFTVMGGVTPTLTSGRGFRANEAVTHVALMSETIAQVNHLRLGSTFAVNGTQFTLIGLYATSNQLAQSSIVIPIATLEGLYQTQGVDTVTATAASFEQVETVAARLRKTLGDKFNVVTQTAQYSDVFSALRIAQNSIQVALVVSFLIAAAVTIFALLMLVRERTAEIAILKTIGASHVQVLWQFWTEILAFSATAAALALVLLALFGSAIAQRFDIDASSLVKTDTSSPGTFFTQTIGGPTITTAANPVGGVHLGAATLTTQTFLIIVGVGLGLALLTNLIPTWMVIRSKPAQILRQAQ
jgi:putative ABC transport system permease protein